MTTHSVILADLDTILDVRIATILEVDDSALEQVVNDGYFDRSIDIFNIDMVKYKALYESRPKSVLLNSTKTPIMSLINEYVQKTLKLAVTTPHHQDPKVLINVYPYTLVEEETRLLLQVLRHYVDGLADIEIVNKSKENITPKYLRDDISLYITYDPEVWLETHSVNENLKTTTCPTVSMIGPAIYKTESLPEVMDEDPFEAMGVLFRPIIDLTHIAVKYFSAEINT